MESGEKNENGELASLGVKDLNAIEHAAESFTNQWAGTNKAEFIGATYDVKSALSSLSDEAVGVFTNMAALTGKATKATTDEMVGTFTTAYGIFKPIMAGMTDMEWATAFSGAMSQTVASFKTDGQQMADAIKNIGAVAAASQVPMQEQLAILGQLQTTMRGSEAGTLYKAFMMKAAEAGDELGLSFVDSAGQLKGVVGILRELQRQFPDLSQAAAQVKLKKAFGSDEAMKFVLQMSQGVGALEGSIKSVEKAMRSGTAVTEKMANAMNMDIGAQFTLVRQQLGNLFEILGKTLLPVVSPVIGGISKAILFFQKLAKSMPGVTRAALTLAMALGGILVVAGGVMAGVGMLGIALPAIKTGMLAIGASAAGIGSAIATYFLPVTAAIAGVVLAVYLMKKAWQTNFAGIRDTVMGAWNKISLAFQGIKTLITSLKDGTGSMSADLAQKLEAAGLMGFVTTVFKMYYRVREFLTGLWGAFSDTFGRIRAILEPTVQSLMSAYAALYRAIFSIVEIFGVAAGAADGSSWRTFGQVIGAVAGVLLQGLAYAIRIVAWNLTMIIRGLTLVVRAVVWAAKVIVGGLVLAGKFAYRFLLPVRLIAQAFVAAGKIIHTVWRVLTGDMSLLNGLKSIAGAVGQFLLTPFRWAKDMLAGIWGGFKAIPSVIGSLFAGLGKVILFPFQIIGKAFDWIRGLFAGDGSSLLGNVFSFGVSILRTLSQGILSVALFPLRMLREVFGKVLSFFSGGGENGLLGRVFSFGVGILKTLAGGIISAIGAPVQLIASVGGSILSGLRSIPEGVGSIFSGIGNVLSAPFKGGAQIVAQLWNGIKCGASSALDAVANAAQSILPALQGVWSGLSGHLSAFAQGAQSAAGNIRDAMLGAFTQIGQRAAAMWNGLRDGMASALRSIESGLGNIASVAGNVLGQAKDMAVGLGGRVADAGRGALRSVGDTADGVWGGMKNAAAWVVGAETPQPLVPAQAPAVSSAMTTQTVSLLPKLRDDLLPRALQAVLHLKPVLAQALPKLSLDVLPKLDTALIPKVFQAALLLTPTLAGAVPDVVPITPRVQYEMVSHEAAPQALPVEKASFLQYAPLDPALPQEAIAPMTVPLQPLMQPAPIMQTTANVLPVLPDIPALSVAGRIEMDTLPQMEATVLGRVEAVLNEIPEAHIPGHIVASQPVFPDTTVSVVPEFSGAPLQALVQPSLGDIPNTLVRGVLETTPLEAIKTTLQAETPSTIDIPGTIHPALADAIPVAADIQGRMQLLPDTPPDVAMEGHVAPVLPELPSAILQAEIQTNMPPLSPLRMDAVISAALPEIAAPTVPLSWASECLTLPEGAAMAISTPLPEIKAPTVPLSWMPECPTLPESAATAIATPLLPMAPVVREASEQPSHALPPQRMDILAEQGARQDTSVPDQRQGHDASLRHLLESLLARLDVVADRPIDLTVTTEIDGRVVAEAVYKDMREQKIRNYETL